MTLTTEQKTLFAFPIVLLLGLVIAASAVLSGSGTATGTYDDPTGCSRATPQDC